jgi:hypothetical protein
VGNLITPKLADHFYSYGSSAGKKDFVADQAVDPKLFEQVAGTIHVPGTQVASLITRTPYSDYMLTVEFKWGEKTYGRRENKPRTAWILLHANGADGSLGKNLMPSVACVLTEGDTGSLRLLGEPDHIKGQTTARELTTPRLRRFHDRGVPAIKVASGTKDWDNTIHRAGFPTTANMVEDVKGFHPSGDLAVKPGEWNKVEITCAGNMISVRVNEKDACDITELNVHGGKIALTSDFAEYTVRKFELTRLNK